MEQRSPSPVAATNSSNPLPFDEQTTPSPFIYPCGITGMGNCILGPRTTASQADMPTTTTNDHEKSLVPTTTKRKLGGLSPPQARTKPDRLPPGVSRAIATSLTNASKRIRPNESNHEPQETQLIPLIADIKTLLTPYLNLHHSCAAAKPLALLYASLSSSTFTPMTLMCLLTDARELLKVLAERQTRIYQNLMPALSKLQQAGMDSILHDARAKAEQTDADVKELATMITECDGMDTVWAAR
jgi:hypothetical protein